MQIYQYDSAGYYTGNNKERVGREPIPENWTTLPPPTNPEYRFLGDGWKDVPPPPPKPVTTITRRQGKQQLVIAGLDEQVELAIDGITNTTERKLTRIWYQDAAEWERDNAQLLSLGDALGLSSSQIDDLFQAASQL